MIQIFKNLVPYWKTILVIIALLIVQAFCDLSLPQFTANIIDVGISSSGKEHILPSKMTAKEYEKAQLFMTEKEQDLFSDSYQKKGKAYVLKHLSKEQLEKQDDKLLTPILINYQMEAVEVNKFKEQLWGNAQVQQALTQAKITKESFMDMDVEAIGQMMGISITSFEKEVEDEDGNKVKNQCVDMRDIFETMAAQGMMDDSAMQSARETFQKMSDTIGSSTLQSMGKKWALEREEEAKVDTEKNQKDYLFSSGMKMLALALLMGLVSILVSFFASRVGASVGRHLRHNIFHQVVGFSNADMDEFSTASLITRSTNDVQQIQMVSIMLLRMVLYAPIIGIGGVIKVLETGAGMGWTIVLAVLVIIGFVMLLMSVTMPKFKIMQKLVDAVNLVSREILTGLSVIRAFGREKKEEERFDEANHKLMKTQLFTNRVMTFMMPGMMTIMYAVDILIVWVAAHKIDDGLLEVGAMTAFITYAMQIVMAFLMLTMMSIMLPRAGVAAERIDEVLKKKASVQEKEHPVALKKKEGTVTFDHVSFAYPNAKEDVLKNISFVAKPGQTTAIIGSTGCGKSTLVNLIPRLYDVTGGKILLDGVDIRDLAMKELREEIGFVPQKGVLFSGTIESNLRFGNKDASDELIRESAEIAQAMEFIDSKDNKFSSRISQGGSNVSGGQKQRLAIARAIAKEPDIFIFDDSFSALDMKTDAKLRKELASKVKDKTVIIVAQRISTILHADQILVLDEGEIVGKGTHGELLRTCEVYEQIARSQLSEKELGITENKKEVQ